MLGPGQQSRPEAAAHHSRPEGALPFLPEVLLNFLLLRSPPPSPCRARPASSPSQDHPATCPPVSPRLVSVCAPMGHDQGTVGRNRATHVSTLSPSRTPASGPASYPAAGVPERRTFGKPQSWVVEGEQRSFTRTCDATGSIASTRFAPRAPALPHTRCISAPTCGVLRRPRCQVSATLLPTGGSGRTKSRCRSK